MEEEKRLEPFFRLQVMVAWIGVGSSGNGERGKYRREIVEFTIGLDVGE